MDDKKKLLIVGMGMWGKTWVNVVRESPYWDAVGYVDVDRKKLDEAISYLGIPESKCYADLDKAIKETNADAILGVTPPSSHRDVTVKAFESGLHVLTEKPIADNLDNAKQMIKESEKRGLKLMVSQNYRFKRGPRTVRKVLADRIIGKPSYVSINFHKAPVFTGYRKDMEYPLLLDLCIHHFDQIRYVLNRDPISIYAESLNPEWSYFKHSPTSSVIVRMEDDVLINYFGSWVSQGWETTWDGDWRIECTEGELHWDNNEVNVIAQNPVVSVFQEGMLEKSYYGTANRGILKVDPIEMPCEERKYSLMEFFKAIEEDREPETSGRDNIKSFAMVVAAVESSKTNRKIDIKEMVEKEMDSNG